MNVTINGEARNLEPDTSLLTLLGLLELEGKRLAIEVNRNIVPRSQFADFLLSDNDAIEIVQAIGGG
jgi:sulfur carrier protein